MLDLISAFPAPCGNEEIIKKFLKTKIDRQWQEDSIGNLIVRFGSGDEKWMVYCPIDEDAVVAMSVKEEKVWFAHLGDKPLHPGDTVSFEGTKGVICVPDLEKPNDGQYIQMLVKDKVEPGMAGTVDGEFHEDEGVVYTKAAAQRAGIAAMLELCSMEPNCDLTLVFGVQGNNGNKGAIVADREIRPDRVIVLEQSEKQTESLTLKIAGSGYVCNKELADDIYQVCEENGIKMDNEVDVKQKTAASMFTNGRAAAIGIPVQFGKQMRQAIQTSTVEELKRLLRILVTKEGK